MPRRWLRLSFACALFLPGLDASVSRGVSVSCARNELPPSPIVTTPQPVVAAVEPTPEPPPVAEPPPPDSKTLLRSWLSARLPAGGALDEDGPELVIVHKAKKGDTVRALAAAYVDLTTLYSEGDLVSAIFKANAKMHHGPLAEGTAIRVPHVVTAIPKTGEEARLGWPKDDPALRGIYANATMAGHPSFPSLLDKMAQRGMNALVIDVKDVTGYFTYPSKIPLAVEVKANKHATVSNFARLVRFAHSRGIRVVARVTCFRDENVGPQRHALAVQRRGGGAHVAPSKIVDWLDPANEQVQAYLVDVVDEALEAGVDEIQLDYVRYPTEGTWDADFKLKERGLTTVQVITDFVKRIHERTLKGRAALSLDVFGVVAWRDKRDIEATGQDLRALAPHIEALSPMVYPSHFAEGFNGYAKPGDHADVVGIGTRRAIQEIEGAGLKVPVRPWVQAFPWRTTSFGAAYVADQIASAKSVGASGWLAWNSGGEYGATFGAVPVLKKPVLALK